MKFLKDKQTRHDFVTYAMCIVAFAIVFFMQSNHMIPRMIAGQLVPITAYIVMAISLNLVVGIAGDLSLGHAGFMSVGAFMGMTAAVSLQGVIASAPLRLAIAMVIGAIFAAIIGFLIGIPVLRLRGDYLAIVTLAFGEIIKSIFTNLYIGLDSRGYHIRFLQAPENLEEGGKLYTQLKIDDINNLGAVKIRIRSLMAAMDARKVRPSAQDGAAS